MEHHYVEEPRFLKYGISITTDHNGKRRVLSDRSLSPSLPLGFMNEASSIAWLRANGYRVNTSKDGYLLTKQKCSPELNLVESYPLGWGSTTKFETGLTIKVDPIMGLIIKVP